MPLPTIHSASTAVAGFVIAAYWLVYVVVIGLETAYPATFTAAPHEAAQSCTRDHPHSGTAEAFVAVCGSIDGESAQVETTGSEAL